MLLKRIVALLLVIPFLFSSCESRKKLVYFQQGDENVENIDSYLSPKLEVGDVLSVEVTATDPQIAAPFNQAELVRQGNQIGSYENGVPATFGYLVALDSTISLPIVGKVKLAGLDRNDAVTLVEEKISEFLEKPSVSIRILNFKVTVLGEVQNPGTFSIPNERVTILEAIGIARDLKITGERRNVLVIRHENGKKIEHRIDLTSKDIFMSPVYYLKQNDVVYVEPNRARRYDASVLRTAGGVIISATSLIVSTLVLITK